MRLTYALLAACAACAFAAATASAAPLDGPVDIREVKVLRPTEGAERGSLVVWARVHHAGVTDAARGKAVAGAFHRGKVRVRIPGLGTRTATRDLRYTPGERGYTVRFHGVRPNAKVAVQVSATQTLDLDGGGGPDQVSRDTSNQRNVTPVAVSQTISPSDGTYGVPGQVDGNGFDVQNGEVAVFWVTSDVGCVNDVVPWAPINPQTGGFSFDYKGVKAGGSFALNNSATIDVSWEGVMGAGGPKCKGALPNNTLYTFFSS